MRVDPGTGKLASRLGPIPPLVAVFAVAIAFVALLAVLGSLFDWDLLKVGEERNIPT